MQKKWRCKVCGYIHEGENPPEVCPVCGVDSTNFELLQPEVDQSKTIRQAMYRFSYGLFIITSHAKGKDNGQCANTCFQITSDPAQVAIGINKNNYTHELISKSGIFGVSILSQTGHDHARNFGYRSGRDVDKFEGVKAHRGESGLMLLDDVLVTMEAKVVGQIDAGTHTLFLGEVTKAEILNEGEPMTYDYFRATK